MNREVLTGLVLIGGAVLASLVTLALTVIISSCEERRWR